MNAAVVVSVVMSVYNDARYLPESLDSVLSQTGVAVELIVMNDGSTDGSAEILDRYSATDSRVRVVHQENKGLTASLIGACSLARGRYIARQDSDDISFQGRFSKLAGYLDSNPDAVLVASCCVLMGPDGEVLLSESPAARVIVNTEANTYCHGSLMFRREAYERAGGYRPHFRAAQDVDLQYRLSELGSSALFPELLYAYRIREGSISSSSPIQKRLSRLAQAARDARKAGKDDREILEDAVRVSSEYQGKRRSEPGTGNYFIGRCLYARRDRRATTYLWAACKSNPFSLRNWTALAQAAAVRKPSEELDVQRSGIVSHQSA